MEDPLNNCNAASRAAMTALSADRPCNDPKDDLFGHAPFARHLAKSIRCHRGGDGLVIALHGLWGSGKTTILNYVCHYLEAEKTEDADPPVVVHFNPWWFSGREDLAQTFLRQLQAALPAKNAKFKRLGELLDKYGESLGGFVGAAVDATGMTGGYAKDAGKTVGRMLQRKPKDVPALKAQIADELREAKVRILVIIDDIDRLDHDEVRQLFTVIKALADFPFVTYLLAFDRKAAVQAIERDSGLPGARYLEKIIQVPFEIPLIDRTTLRDVVLRRLDEEVLNCVPDDAVDQGHGAAVLVGGIERLVCVPRDVIRLVNTLSVTFPAVAGEVNPVDFIAIEMLRVFLPELYDTIRLNEEKFTGSRAASGATSVENEFHERWASELPEPLRDGMREMMGRLFPKIAAVSHSGGPPSQWRRDLRICHPELFHMYFRLSLLPGAVSHGEVMALIAAIATPENFKGILLRAKEETALGGISKSRALIKRVGDHVASDITEGDVPRLIAQVLDIGDELIGPELAHRVLLSEGEERMSDEVLMRDLVCRSLKRMKMEDRPGVLFQAIEHGHALVIQECVLHELDPATTSGAGGEALIGTDDLERLKKLWCGRVQALSVQRAFLMRPRLLGTLASWRLWGDASAPRRWCEAVASTDEGLLALLMQFLRHDLALEDRVRPYPRLNSRSLEPYLDTRLCFDRLLPLRDRGAIPSEFQPAANQFIREYELLAQGKNPDVPR